MYLGGRPGVNIGVEEKKNQGGLPDIPVMRDRVISFSELRKPSLEIPVSGEAPFGQCVRALLGDPSCIT